ncbi:GNAT family N-acetyltransferase [Microbulbifer sp. CAU 1566]|uniref:GNAT family N-acetyltransferase n=1 Tax=Microbulbifer sp. CAU 1566 TaxID=2933269 RepID=UPI002005B0A0|nr:GNAT family N-acetyltransferase [Microbulbifer sp. CAU 1566]MCK7596527.1 GNAT family N-acetyltransferase [Microbulbifer sp. CAU 1566]
MEKVNVTDSSDRNPATPSLQEKTAENQLDQANIDNLTTLWRVMGAQRAYREQSTQLYACHRWPYRHWFEADSVPPTETLANIFNSLPPSATVPIWDATAELGTPLHNAGFKIGSEQRAMHLELAQWQPAPTDSALNLTQVRSAAELEHWVRICSDAFGYEIDTGVMANAATNPETSLWLAEQKGVAVATALLFRTGDVIGIHQVGVPEAYRGRGIARALMQQLLNHCRQTGARYATLQASTMGEGLYRQLGFKSRFLITNYRRN